MADYDTNHIYIIKERKKIEMAAGPFEYEELLCKCTSIEEARRVLDTHPEAYISEDSTYNSSDLFRYE